MSKITDEQAIAAARALQEHGTKAKAAEALGLARSTFRGHYDAFVKRDLSIEEERVVILLDDRSDKIRTRKVTQQERHDFFQTHGEVYDGADYVPMLDKKGNKILDLTAAQITLKGKHLENAMRRAKRWMKNNPAGTSKRMPWHIHLGARAIEELET